MDIFNALKKFSEGDVSFTESKASELNETALKAYEQAQTKLQNESNLSTDPNVKYVAEYLLNLIKEKPDLSDFINQNGKTIAGGISEMRKVAEKGITDRRGAQTAIISDKEGFAIIEKYFGISK